MNIISSPNIIHPLAIPFLQQVGNILFPYEIKAINNLVKDLVGNDLWNSFTAIYPFVGRSAYSHSLNLLEVNSYQITWFGGITHNINGITGNGSTGYGDLGFLPSAIGSVANGSITLYVRSYGTTFSTVMTGANGTGGAGTTGIHFVGPPPICRSYILSNTTVQSTSSIGSGVISVNAVATNNLSFYRNGVLNAINTTTRSPGLASVNMYILANNNNSSTGQTSSANLSFAAYGRGLRIDQIAIFHAIITNFQQNMDRAV